MRHGLEALGRAIAKRRAELGMTQSALAEKAEYGRGGDVSISRIEHGLTRPGEDRVTKIAAALGLTVAELDAAAATEAATIAAQRAESTRETGWLAEDATNRAERIEEVRLGRAARYDKAAEAFDAAHERAVGQYYARLVEITAGIEGLTPLGEAAPATAAMTAAQAGVAVRFHLARGGVSAVVLNATQFAAMGVAPAVGLLAGYGSLRAVIAFGEASTGAKIRDLHGAAQMNAAMARSGGGALLAGGGGMVAGAGRLDSLEKGVTWGLPIVVAIATAARRAWKNQKLHEQLDIAEDELNAAKHGYTAAVSQLPRAAAILDDIAVHGTRALERWAARLGPEPWGELDPVDLQRYQDEFRELAAVVAVVGSIDFPKLLTSRGEEQDDLIAIADETLTQSEETVARLV